MNTQIISAYIYAGLPPVKKKNFIFKMSDASYEVVVNIVCNRLCLSPIEVLGSTRPAHLAKARMIIFYLLSTAGKYNLCQIGREFKKHHSTILYNRDACKDWMQVDKKFKNLVESIKDDIRIATQYNG